MSIRPFRTKTIVMTVMAVMTAIVLIVYYHARDRSTAALGVKQRNDFLQIRQTESKYSVPSERLLPQEVDMDQAIQAVDTADLASRQELRRGREDPEPTATSRRLQTPDQLQTYLEQRAVRVKEVDCLRVFRGESQELQKALRLEQQPEQLPTDAQIHDLASNCSRFLHQYGFLMDPLTDVENQFPIAFSILAYKESSQVVDLLRTIYRPQNFYCIHADEKSSPDFKLALESVSRCLPNVFMASRSVEVHWGFYTVIEPELVCMGDLWRNKTWKYFINLTGQEFPLKTNYELVRILTAFKGANDIQALAPSKGFRKRWEKFLPAPHNISVYGGPTHIVASRGYVDFVLHAPPAQDFLRWCQQTDHAAEHYFNSLNRNPHLHVPGGYLERPNKAEKGVTSLARYKNWVPMYPCPGKRVVRGICILNVLDLPMLYRGPQLFANKFHAGYSRLALRCLAEELHNRTRDQTLGQRRFDVTVYEQFVLNRQTNSLSAPVGR